MFPVQSSPLRTQRTQRYSPALQRFPEICPWSLHKLSEQTIVWMDDRWYILDFYLPSAVFAMIYKMSVLWVLPQSFLASLCEEWHISWGLLLSETLLTCSSGSTYLAFPVLSLEWRWESCAGSRFTVLWTASKEGREWAALQYRPATYLKVFQYC